MKAFIAPTKIDLKLALRNRSVLFFNYFFLSLVPKLHLGTPHCLGSSASRDAEAQVRQRAKRSFEDNFRCQVQLGNEGRAKCDPDVRWFTK